MSDSHGPDPPPDREFDRRLEAIHRWVEYVESTPPEVWGEQLNTLVNGQLEAAREAGLPADDYRRIDRAAAALEESTGDEPGDGR